MTDEIKHFLAGVNADKEKETDPLTWNLNFVRSINDEEYLEILAARERIDLFRRDNSVYRVFIFGYDELINFHSQAQEMFLNRSTKIDLHGIIMIFDAKLTALFSFFKSFLEYWKHRYTNSALYSDLFNFYMQENISFRICYFLRNYAQHYASPLVNCNLKSDNETIIVDFHISKEMILNSKVRWESMNEDLSEEFERLRVFEHLKALKECLAIMHHSFIRYDFPTVDQACQKLKKLQLETVEKYSGVEPWIVSPQERGSLTIIDVEPDQLDFIDSVRDLMDGQSKNKEE